MEDNSVMRSTAPKFVETAQQIALKYRRPPEDRLDRSAMDVYSMAVPLPPPVEELPAWSNVVQDVYQPSNFMKAPAPEYRPVTFPKAPPSGTPVVPENSTRPRMALREKKIPITTAYSESYIHPGDQRDAGLEFPNYSAAYRPYATEADNTASYAARVSTTDHYKTTYDHSYQIRKDDMRPYSQHLLRYKTTSWLTSPSLGGSVGTGNHVMRIGSQTVASGLAPSEQHLPLRRSNGGREMLEVMHGDAMIAAIEHPVPMALSQCHPPQTQLLRHMLEHDNGSYTWRTAHLDEDDSEEVPQRLRPGKASGDHDPSARSNLNSRGSVRSATARTVKDKSTHAVVPTILQFRGLKHCGANSAYGDSYKDPFRGQVDQERAVWRMHTRRMEGLEEKRAKWTASGSTRAGPQPEAGMGPGSTDGAGSGHDASGEVQLEDTSGGVQDWDGDQSSRSFGYRGKGGGEAAVTLREMTVPAGCAGLDPATIPKGQITVPRSFNNVQGVMIEDIRVADMLKRDAAAKLMRDATVADSGGHGASSIVPRAKKTSVDKLIAFAFVNPPDYASPPSNAF